MIIPIRCFTCGKTLADKYDYYIKEVEALKASMEAPKEAKAAKKGGAAGGDTADEAAYRHFDKLRTAEVLDKMGLTRYCCRRHMLTTVDMMDVI